MNKILGWDGTEVWQSQADQAAFMQNELGPGFAEAAVPEPTRVEWFTNVADVHRH